MPTEISFQVAQAWNLQRVLDLFNQRRKVFGRATRAMKKMVKLFIHSFEFIRTWSYLFSYSFTRASIFSSIYRLFIYLNLKLFIHSFIHPRELWRRWLRTQNKVMHLLKPSSSRKFFADGVDIEPSEDEDLKA